MFDICLRPIYSLDSLDNTLISPQRLLYSILHRLNTQTTGYYLNTIIPRSVSTGFVFLFHDDSIVR